MGEAERKIENHVKKIAKSKQQLAWTNSYFRSNEEWETYPKKTESIQKSSNSIRNLLLQISAGINKLLQTGALT